jgi:hypothetical protein
MPFFNIKNGNIKAIKDQPVIDKSDLAWLVEHIMLNDDIFTERLLLIGQDKSAQTIDCIDGADYLRTGERLRNGDSKPADGYLSAGNCPLANNYLQPDSYQSANNYLMALDEKAELVVVHISDKTPDAKNIGSVCELAWSLRNLTYDDLEDMATRHFANAGINVTDLVDLHSQHFNSERPVRSKRFNETQRVFILAPSFDQASANAISWRRAETDISAYAFNIIETENSERLLIVQPDVKGGAISSVMSAVGNMPAAIKRKLLRKDKV